MWHPEPMPGRQISGRVPEQAVQRVWYGNTAGRVSATILNGIGLEYVRAGPKN
jgi:hypothetical protein